MERDLAARRRGFSSADFPTGLDMDIRFPSEAPSWHDANRTVGCPALMDGACAHLELSYGTPVLRNSGHFPPGRLLS